MINDIIYCWSGLPLIDGVVVVEQQLVILIVRPKHHKIDCL